MAIGYTHSLTKGYKTDMGTVSSVVQTFTGGAQVGMFVSVAAGAVNQLETIQIPQAKIVSCVLSTTKATVVVKTNSSGSPHDTITVTSPAFPAQIEWDNTQTVACPFSTGADVTAVYLSNSSSVATDVRIEVLLSD